MNAVCGTNVADISQQCNRCRCIRSAFVSKTQKRPHRRSDGMASFVRYLSPDRLFCGGCLGSLGGSFSSSFSSGSYFFTAAAACLRLAGFGILKHGLVVVYQLDEAGLGVVTETVAGFENAGVSAGTLADFLSNFLEEYLHGLFVLEVAEDEAAVGHCIFLGTVDNGLGVNAESLSLCQRGVDTLVEDERDGHIGQQRRTVSGLAAKVIEFLIVSHRGLFFIEFVFRDVHAEGEIEARKEVLKLDEGLFAEVAEFEQIGFVEYHQFGESFYLGAL